MMCSIRHYKASKARTEHLNESIIMLEFFDSGGRPSADVKYSSSDNSIASVTSKGIITALKSGSAVITASSGGKDIKIMVDVEE